jgi:hypothetical protein
MKELEQRIIPRETMSNRITGIGTVSTNRNDAWRALYAKDTNGEIVADLRPVAAWCSALTSHGNVIGYSPDDGTYAVYGLVIVGNRLEIADTHADFIAYVQNPDARTIRDLIYDWRMTNNQ